MAGAPAKGDCMDYRALADEDLAALAEGDAAAHDALLARYKNFVKMAARPYFIIGADQDDLVQEGMIGLYKAIREYRADKEASFATYANICIKNQILTAIKNASRKKHGPLNTYVSIDQENPEVLHIIDHHNNPEHALAKQESRRKIQSLFSTSLSPLESAILAHFLAGLSYAEIAEAQSIAPKSVDNALFRIRRKVAKLLQADESSNWN